MIDFETIERVVETWFANATGLKVQWKGDDTTHKPRAYGEMDIHSVIGIGIDENVTTYDATQAAGRELLRNAQGNRQFTLSLKVISRDRRPSKSAKYFIEKARTSLHKPGTLTEFRTAELSVAKVLGAVDSFNPYQKRQENWSMIDVRMNTVANETDDREQGSLIESTLVTSDVDGWPSGIELTDEEIPS